MVFAVDTQTRPGLWDTGRGRLAFGSRPRRFRVKKPTLTGRRAQARRQRDRAHRATRARERRQRPRGRSPQSIVTVTVDHVARIVVLPDGGLACYGDHGRCLAVIAGDALPGHDS